MLTNEDVRRLLDIAAAGINAGEIASARKICEGIIAGHPEHAPAKILLALSHIAVGEYEAADLILKDDVLQKTPNDPDALVYLGLSAHLAGRKDEAVEILGRVPADAPAQRLAAAILEENA